MRIVLFYSETESFNFFSDQLAKELQTRGHETFILNLPPSFDGSAHSFDNFSKFVSQKVDAAICFDGLGTMDDTFIGLWDAWQTVLVDILMDPPLRFHSTLKKHPQNYLLFCCDWDHVEYVKKYFGTEVSHVDFMPHVGVIPDENESRIPYAEKKYDILFSGTYYTPENFFLNIEKQFPKDSLIYTLYQYVFDCLKENPDLTMEQAMLYTMEKLALHVEPEHLKNLLHCSESVDWAIRMYERGRVVQTLAEAGFELYLLGRGWENHSSAGYPNVHHISGRVPYAETLPYMADAKINLNVFPWFKAGTHDRIFNTLLRHSVPLTDSSRWVMENFTDGEDIALYDLKHLERLPDIVSGLLGDCAHAEAMIQKGYEKVLHNFTYSNCTDWILDAIEKHYNIR